MLKVKLLQIWLLFGLLVVGLTINAQAQPTARQTEYVGNRGFTPISTSEQEVNRAFNAKDFERISKNFDENVEISFPNKEGTFSKIQAKFVLKEFFSDYPATEFEHSYVGVTSSKLNRYTIGEYKTEQALFEVRISYKSKQGIAPWVIDRITIVQK